MSRKMMSELWPISGMASIIPSRRLQTSKPTPTSLSSCIKLPKRNAKGKMTSSMPSSHPSPMASPTPKLQRLPQLLPQPSHLQATATSQVTRKLRQPQVVLLLHATSSRKLHHHLPQPMRPSRQVPSNASHAEAEATSPLSAQTSAP